jgi:EmrB/QacA subfamily drug resistance transporter
MSLKTMEGSIIMNTTSQMRTRSPAPGRPVRHGAVTAVVCIALATVVAAMSSLNVAIPSIAQSTHASQTQLAWVIDAYSLVFAAFLLPAGALGDRFGRRRSLLAGLVIFAAGSAAAMSVSGASELIALRTVIGLGAALVMPATLSTITGTFPPARRTKAVSIWAAVSGGAAIFGVLGAGVLLEFFSWRSVFGLNIALAVIAIIGTLLVVPESADPHAPRLDRGGAALAVLALVALVYSVIQAPTAGWGSTQTVTGLGLGLGGLAAFVVWELRQRTPMLDPRLFTHPRLGAGSLSIFLQFFAFYGFNFLFLQYLQIIRGDSALIAAVSMLPLAATLLPTSRLAPALTSRFGARRMCAAGLALIAAALVIIAQVSHTSPYWQLAAGLLVLGAGMGAAMTPATSNITTALPPAKQGVASAINDLSRAVGGALGIAVIGSVMTAIYRSHLTLPGVPAAVLGQARDSAAVAARIGGPVAARAGTAFIDGIHAALYTAAGAAVLAAVAVFVLLGRRASNQATAQVSHETGPAAAPRAGVPA